MDYQLSNFYTEIASDPEQFQQLLEFYSGVADIFIDYMSQIEDNTILSKTETYRLLPIQMIDITLGQYDLRSVLVNNYIVENFNLQNLSVLERIDLWNTSLTLDQKVDILNITGKYISLSAIRNIYLDETQPQIVDLKVFDTKNIQLTENVDYIIKNNNLYLFNSQETITSYQKNLILKDIFIDYKISDTLLGERLGVKYNDSLSKDEYRDMMQMFINASLGGPTIGNLNKAFNSELMGDISFKVIDKLAKNSTKKSLWANDNVVMSAQLSPYDFIVSMPVDLYYQGGKVNLIHDYLSIIKPADTNYIIAPEVEISDALNIRNGDSLIKMNLSIKPGSLNNGSIFDTITMTDIVSLMIAAKMEQIDLLHPAGTVYRTDDGNRTDDAIPYADFDNDYQSGLLNFSDKVNISIIHN